MAQQTIIPFGPQHPVLPEPVHLDLVLEDETVVNAIPQIGFVHRGLEKLVETRDYQRYVFVAERVCGICSFGHSCGYSQAVEQLMDIEVPRRAQYLRVIWHELSRIHSHLLWLGLAADAMGFESLFMHSWRLRERILDIFEKTTGGRVILSVCTPGGVFKDIEDTELKAIVGVLAGLRDEYDQIAATFLEDGSVRNRLSGVGILTPEMALRPRKRTRHGRAPLRRGRLRRAYRLRARHRHRGRLLRPLQGAHPGGPPVHRHHQRDGLAHSRRRHPHPRQG